MADCWYRKSVRCSDRVLFAAGTQPEARGRRRYDGELLLYELTLDVASTFGLVGELVKHSRYRITSAFSDFGGRNSDFAKFRNFATSPHFDGCGIAAGTVLRRRHSVFDAFRFFTKPCWPRGCCLAAYPLTVIWNLASGKALAELRA